jgi:TolB-like protein
VLPFQNMSGDPEQEYFADGMVEDIITFKSLFVIARTSSFTYKGKAVDIKQVGRELGVRYVLEGSVRKAGDRVRISGQLIEAESGAHLWADRFDGSLEDVFALQDHVTTSVVGAIAPQLDKAETARAARKPVENLDAYDLFLRGLALHWVLTRESSEEALRLFYRAIELDPEYSTPYGLAARCYVNRVDQGWIVDQDWEIVEIRRLAARVIAIGRDDALALCAAGHALVRVCRDADGEDLLDRAIAVNPNMAMCWRNRSFASLFAGHHERAIEEGARAIRLSPLDPQIDRTELAMASALLFEGRQEEALAWANRSLLHQPNSLVCLRAVALINAFAGKLDEARRVMAKVRQLAPNLCISDLQGTLPFRRPQDVAKWIDGLRRAGLPE